MTDWDSLSDEELEARLCKKGMAPELAPYCVKLRNDSPIIRSIITKRLR